MKKFVRRFLDYLKIHSIVTKIRLYIPTVIQRKKLKKYGEKSLIILNEIFEKNDSFFWLEFGTLLGAYRDKAFISHDFDIDLGVLAENRIENLNEILSSLGFTKSREIIIPEIGITEETYLYYGLHIDLFYFYKVEDDLICYSALMDKDLPFDEPEKDKIQCTLGLLMQSFSFKYSGFERSFLYNTMYYFPTNADLHLRECYGSYRVKVKNWSDSKCPNRKATEFRGIHTFFR